MLLSATAPSRAAPIGLPELHPAERLLTAIAALPAATTPWAVASSAPLLSPQRFLSLASSILRWALVFTVLQMGRKLQKQCGRLVSEREAAVDASRFTEVAPGIELHHILSTPAVPSGGSGEPLLMHFAHGFGANSLTWEPLFGSLRRTLSQRSSGTALTLCAHDRLGFGLSPRPRDVRQYSQAAGAAFALKLVESLLGGPPPAGAAAQDAPGKSAVRPADRTASPQSVIPKSDWASDAARNTESEGSDSDTSSEATRSPRPSSEGASEDKVLLVGHSLGGALSARMLTQALAGKSEVRPRGLVLIAPALIAPPAAQTTAPTASATSTAAPTSPSRARRLLRPLTRAAGALAAAVDAAASVLVVWALRVSVLSIIFSEAFWRRGVGAAYHEPARLTADMLLAYRWPSQVRTCAPVCERVA